MVLCLCSLVHHSTYVVALLAAQIPKSCPGVPSEVLNPRNTWADKEAFNATLSKLAGLFNKNFLDFAAGASPETIAAAPEYHGDLSALKVGLEK